MPSFRPARLALTGVLALSLAVALLVADQVTHRRAEADELRRSEALAELDDDAAAAAADVRAAADGLDDTPAAAAHALADVLLADADTADDAEQELGDHTATLREHADELTAAASDAERVRPHPILAPDDVGDVTDDLDELATAGERTATTLTAAAELDTLATTATRLRDGFAHYGSAALDLPDDDDPEVIAEAWERDRTRLARARTTIEATATHPELAPWVAAMLETIDELDGHSRAAIAALDDEDLDTYDEVVREGFGEDARAAISARLGGAADVVLRDVVAELEQARAENRALLTRADRLHRAVQAPR